jgi:hypothetical protein
MDTRNKPGEAEEGALIPERTLLTRSMPTPLPQLPRNMLLMII